MFLISKIKDYRRRVRRAVPNENNSSGYYRRRHRWYYPQPQPAADSAPARVLPTLIPSLLLLNHEIYAETQPILYGSNDFAFEDTTALHHFLASIGSKNCATLTDVTLRGWGQTKSHKALNFPAFTLLANAVNLTRLHLDCRIKWGSGPKSVAKQVYRDGFHWLEAVGVAKGTKDGAVELIEVMDGNFDEWRGYGHNKSAEEKPTPEERLEIFRTEMRKLLR